MGLEVGLLTTIGAITGAGLSVASGISGMNTAKNQANALKKEAALKAKKVAENTVSMAGTQKASFLASGIGIDGSENSTPMAVLGKTYTTGREDVRQINENYNTAIGNIYSKARGNLLDSFAKAALGLTSSGMFSGSGVQGDPMGGMAENAGGEWEEIPDFYRSKIDSDAINDFLG